MGKHQGASIGRLLIWNIEPFANTMARRKDISRDVRVENVGWNLGMAKEPLFPEKQTVNSRQTNGEQMRKED